MPFVIPMIGANPSRRTTTKEYKLGTAQVDDSNRTWVYVQASGAIAAAATVIVDANFSASSGAGSYTADTAFAANEYGWVRKTASPL